MWKSSDTALKLILGRRCLDGWSKSPASHLIVGLRPDRIGKSSATSAWSKKTYLLHYWAHWVNLWPITVIVSISHWNHYNLIKDSVAVQSKSNQTGEVKGGRRMLRPEIIPSLSTLLWRLLLRVGEFGWHFQKQHYHLPFWGRPLWHFTKASRKRHNTMSKMSIQKRK